MTAARSHRLLQFASSSIQCSWRWLPPVSLLASQAGRSSPSRALVLLGVCLDSCFRLEAIARNHWRAEPDIDGVEPYSTGGAFQSLIAGAPELYLSTLPIESVRDRAAGTSGTLPVRISSDAGAYICNQVYYLARHFLGDAIPHIGFVHVPPLASARVETFWSDADVIRAGISVVHDLAAELRQKRPDVAAATE